MFAVIVSANIWQKEKHSLVNNSEVYPSMFSDMQIYCVVPETVGGGNSAPYI